MAIHPEFRTHTLTIADVVRTSDGAGGWTRTYSDVGTVVGSLQPSSGTEQQIGETERARVRWTFYCDLDEPLVRDQRLTDPSTDMEFLIVDVLRWRADSSIDHLRVDLEQIQKGS